jgi:hypothetical protein
MRVSELVRLLRSVSMVSFVSNVQGLPYPSSDPDRDSQSRTPLPRRTDALTSVRVGIALASMMLADGLDEGYTISSKLEAGVVASPEERRPGTVAGMSDGVVMHFEVQRRARR